MRAPRRVVDQCSCMALHNACPVQRSKAPHLDARNSSVSARPCPGAPPSCPMQELSRTPQTYPINDRSPSQTCWSTACAYAKRREKRRYLVAGVQDHRTTVGLKTRRSRWSAPALCSCIGQAPTQHLAVPSMGPEKPPTSVVASHYLLEVVVVLHLILRCPRGWTLFVVPVSVLRSVGLADVVPDLAPGQTWKVGPLVSPFGKGLQQVFFPPGLQRSPLAWTNPSRCP